MLILRITRNTQIHSAGKMHSFLKLYQVLYYTFTGGLYTVKKICINNDTIKQAILYSECRMQRVSSFPISLPLFFISYLLTSLALFSFSHSLFEDSNLLRHDDMSISK